MRAKGEAVTQRQGSDFPAQSAVAILARKLRRGSPVRNWLERRKANPTACSGKDLLAALEHPHTDDWKDRVVGFEALGAVELSPGERRQAGRLLSEVFDPTRARTAWIPRLGRAVACLFMIGMILPLLGLVGYVIFELSYLSLSQHTLLYLQRTWEFVQSGSAVGEFATELLAPLALPCCFLGMFVLPCLYFGLDIWDRAHAMAVQRSAMRAMARIGGADGIVAPYDQVVRFTELSPEALFTLRALLPTIDSSWYGQLPTGSHTALEGLAACSDENLAIGALDVMERAGAGDSANVVRQIAERASTTARVRERALAVLPTLLARQEQEAANRISLPSQETCPTEIALGASFLFQPTLMKLERKLGRKSPVLAWLKRRRENAPTSSGAALLTALRDPDASGWADRAIAYHALGEIDLLPAERPRAAQLLLHALAPSPVKGKMFSRLGTSVLLALPISLVAACLVQPYYPFFHIGCIVYDMVAFRVIAPITLVLTVPPFFAGLSLLERRRTAHVQQAAATSLVRVGDPECLVALYDHVRRRTAAQKEALKALRAILPTITADWYGRLPAGSGAALGALAESPDEEMALEALAALEQAGDGSAAQAVERMVENGVSDRVRKRAAAVLPTLIARHEREMSAASLLRPSDRISTEHLLKPVYGNASETANLLRASQAGGSEGADRAGL